MVPPTGLEYIRKYRDAKYYETIFEFLARQLELAKLDQAKEGAIIQTVDPAIVPDRKSFPPRALIVAAGIFAGLLAGISLALMRTSLARMHGGPEAHAKFSFLRTAFSMKHPRRRTDREPYAQED